MACKPFERFKNMHCKHDAWFKFSMSDHQVMHEMIERYVPDFVLQDLDWTTVRLAPTEFTSAIFRKTHADILCQARLHNGEYLYILWEHQSKSDPNMGARLFNYSYQIAELHHRSHKSKTYPFVLPMLIYSGKRTPYPGAVSLFESLKESLYAKKILMSESFVVDLTCLGDELLSKEKVRSGLFAYILKHLHEPSPCLKPERLLESIRLMCQNKEDTYVNGLIEFIYRGVGLPEGDLDTLLYQLKKETGDNMRTIAEALEQRGLRKGRQEGRQEGRQAHKRSVIANMHTHGAESEMIAKFVGISKTEVLGVLEQLKTEAVD